MAVALSPGTTDVAGQIGIVQGVDSNVFQTQATSGAIARHPAAFTSLEASFGMVHFGQVGGDTSDVRAFGRFSYYEPLSSGDFTNPTARGGLSARSAIRLDRRTTLLSSMVGSVGSLQVARGTDGAPATIDAVSTRRSAWNAIGAESLAFQLSARTTVTLMASLGLAGTIAETAPGTSSTVHRGLDAVIVTAGVLSRHRLDRLTALLAALHVVRTNVAYTLRGGDPAGPSLGSIDGGALNATGGVERLLSQKTTATAGVGVSLTIPQFGHPARVLPLANVELVHTEDTWSTSARLGVMYDIAQPRLGPGASTMVSLGLMGRPFSGVRNAPELVAFVSGLRTSILAGPNDGATALSGSASVALRWPFAGNLGLFVQYDVLSSRFVGQPWYVRHLGFIGLSYAWSSAGEVSPMPTVAAAPGRG